MAKKVSLYSVEVGREGIRLLEITNVMQRPKTFAFTDETMMVNMLYPEDAPEPFMPGRSLFYPKFTPHLNGWGCGAAHTLEKDEIPALIETCLGIYQDHVKHGIEQAQNAITFAQTRAEAALAALKSPQINSQTE